MPVSAPLRLDLTERQINDDIGGTLMSAETETGDSQSLESPSPTLTDTTVMELFPNFAENEEVVNETKKLLSSIFSNISDRTDLETIWEKNDEMYRVKPDASKDDVHRANESTGVFHVSVNQLVSMAFKFLTDNVQNYKYGYKGVVDDEVQNIARKQNADILTKLFHKALSTNKFKKNLKRILHNVYKNGNGFVGVPWEKRVVDMVYRDKDSGERKTKEVEKNNLPGMEFIPIDRIWLDENIDEIDDQPAIFIRHPISWSSLLVDSKKNKVRLFKGEDGEDGFKNRFEKYKDSFSSTEFNTAKSDRMDNADRPMQDRTSEFYQHWIIWALLPIDKKTGKWDKDGEDVRCRVRILGTPEGCEVIEIRANVFPDGVPILVTHQTEDDVGMYHISLGEKVKSYFDQICTAVNQLIDNRSKNCRRPIIVDPMRVTNIDAWDFGHSNVLNVTGDVTTAFKEAQLTDMTSAIVPTIQYCELKVREIMNTIDAVMGQAMGGRTSASEYMGAKASATTPIFSDMASIEDDIIGGYMRKFAQYVHTFMTLEDIISQVGKTGESFQFHLNDVYSFEMRGVIEAMDKAARIQNLMQLFSMSMDANARSKIMLRIAETMDIENPGEMVAIPAKDQAVKAALWENNEMLVSGQWDEPDMGEMHDVHLQIHKQALWEAQGSEDENASTNAPMLQDHIGKTEYLKRQEQSMGGASPLPAGENNGPQAQAGAPPLPGNEQGQNIAGELGNLNAGSPIPA